MPYGTISHEKNIEAENRWIMECSSMMRIPPFDGTFCMIDKKGGRYCGWLANGHPFCPRGCEASLSQRLAWWGGVR